MLAGSLLETAGVLLLVPVIQILLGDPGWPGSAALDLLADLGLTEPRAQIGAVLALFAVLVVVRFLVLLARDVETARLREGFVTDLRARAFRSLSAVPWPDLAGRGHGRIGHALARDVDRVSDTVGSVITAALGLLHLVVQLCIAFVLAPLLMVVIALIGAGGYAALGGLRRRAVRQGSDLTEADFALFSTTTTYLGGLKPARAHGLETEYAAAFTATARRLAEERVRQDRDYVLSRLSVQAAVAMVGLAAVAAGVFLVSVPPERLIVLILILGRLSGPFQSVQSAAQYIGYATAAYASLNALTGQIGQRDPAVAPPPGRPLERAPAISFHDVSWSGGGAELLVEIDCEIPAGRITALTGHSGAGKSLFCDLATGLLTPRSGRVELHGAPLDAGLIARLAASLAYVGQEPFVIEDTLRANLCWGCGQVSDEDIWRALDAVGAAGLARGLAGGLDGSVRAGGSRFSGGERQRLRLAHALLRRPKFMVLDEATNALDLDAERAVLAGLRRAAAQATVLMVTHRPSTLDIADHVLVLERGRLAWAGPPGGIDPGGRLSLAAGQP